MSASILKSTKSYISLRAASVYFLVFAQPALAQIEQATRAADPARAQSQILDQRDALPLTPIYEVKEAILQKAPAGAENVRLTLKNIEIEGITAYAKSDIESLYADKIGTNVTLADVYGISSAITTKYRNEGYILTQVYIPPQTIESGIIKMKVVEGFVDKISVEGETAATEAAQVQKYAENVKMKGVLNAKELERNLLLINDLPGVTARTILSPSTTTVGASDMTVIVERDRSEAELGFDNFGSRYLGAYQGTAIGALNSPFKHNERIGGQFVLAGDNERIDELGYGSLSYEQPISRTGTKARLQASYARTRPGYDLEEFDVKGRSRYFSASVLHPFIRTRDQNLTGRGTFDWRDVNSENNIETEREDKIRSIRAGLNYEIVDTLWNVAVNALDVEISKGLGLFGASDKGDANMSRERGDPQYTKATANAQRLQKLTPKVNLLIAGEGQISADPLLSSEEFGVGGMGMGFGRGYDPSEIVGDDGIAGKLELQINNPVPVNGLHNYQLFTFLDSGRVWDQDATSNADKTQSLTSIGFGARIDVTEQTRGGVAIAVPLTREIDSRDDRDIRLLLNVNHEF